MFDELLSEEETHVAETESQLSIWRRQGPAESPDRRDEPVRAGYGACTASYCSCTGFMGSADLCANCSHNYSFHR